MEQERERALPEAAGCCGQGPCPARLRLETVALRVREMLATSAVLARVLAEEEGAREEERGAAESARERAQLPEQALHLQAVVLRLKARGEGGKGSGAKELEKTGRVY